MCVCLIHTYGLPFLYVAYSLAFLPDTSCITYRHTHIYMHAHTHVRSPRAALAALKEEVAIGDEEGWTASGYRPFEALALLEEMAAWLRYACVCLSSTRVDRLA